MQRFGILSPLPLTVLLVCIFAMPIQVKAEERKPVTIEENSPLHLRVLTRPKAILYSDASEAKPLEGQLPVFKPYYVYTRPGGEAREGGTGWYEVGTNAQGAIVGWIKASDVFEWKQTMCLAFSHPEGRKPVLMFEEEETLDTLLAQTIEARETEVAKLYAAVDGAATTPLPADFPVISVEPKLAVDITKQFYLLPILEHKTVTMESYEGRMLLLAAVSGKADVSRDKTGDIRTNPEYAAGATATEDTHAQKKADIQYDVVWVMDTTRSMQPYIEEVRNTLESMSQSLGVKKEVAERLRFGLWAYRDSEEIKDIGYLTKNFTPELQELSTFVTTLNDVKETTTDSVDVNEDMFAGVHDAITKTAWREGAMRIIIVVGDAPAHEAGHKWNSSKQDEKTLRELATQNNVFIATIHVTPKIRKKYNNLAARQFKVLSANPGTGTEGLSAFLSVASSERANFVEKTKGFADEIARYLESTLEESKPSVSTAEGDVPPATEKSTATNQESPASDAAPSANEVMRQVLRAATVQWLGSAAEAEAPNDVEAWVTDKDLLNPSIQALEVRLLISKSQLDSLAGILNDVIVAGQNAQMGSDDFFTSLQGVAAAASRNADQLGQAKNMQESGLIPAFLQGLPYKSQIMTMSSELWESFGPDEQDQFITVLSSKVAAYQSLHDTPGLWIALNEGDASDDYVTPISLDLLP